MTAALALTLVLAGVSGAIWWDRHSKEVARDQRVAEVAEAVALEQAWIAEQNRAASAVRAAALRTEATERAWAQVTSAAEVLGASQGRVSEEMVREDLAAAIEAVTGALERGAFAELAAVCDALDSAIATVQEAQAAWEVAESERVAAEAAAQAAADAAAAQPAAPAPAPTSPGTSAPIPSSTPAPPASPASPEPAAPSGGEQAPATSEEPPAQSKVINPGRSSTDGTPGMTTVTATTSGITGPVYATVAGVTLQMGTGSGSFSVTFTGLPAGEHQWSISADGLTAYGTSLMTVF